MLLCMDGHSRMQEGFDLDPILNSLKSTYESFWTEEEFDLKRCIPLSLSLLL